MKKNGKYAMSLIFIFTLGFLAGKLDVAPVNAQSKQTTIKPAYLMVSALIKNPEQMKPYSEKALPLAQEAGFKMLGTGESGTTIQLLEGQWPYKGSVYVEKYNSMDALLRFWNSTAYQEARKLREGIVDVNFIIAVEGLE